MFKKILLFVFMLFILAGSSLAVTSTWTPPAHINGQNFYSIINISEINGSFDANGNIRMGPGYNITGDNLCYANGSNCMSVAGADNATILNLIESNNYINDSDDFNASQIQKQSDNRFGIRIDWLDTLIDTIIAAREAVHDIIIMSWISGNQTETKQYADENILDNRSPFVNGTKEIKIRNYDAKIINLTNGTNITLRGTNGDGKIFIDGKNGRIEIGGFGEEEAGLDFNDVVFIPEFRINDIGGNRPANSLIHVHSEVSGIGARLVGVRANSSNATHFKIGNGFDILKLIGVGYTGTHYDYFGEITIESASGTINSTSSPGRILFRVTPELSDTLVTQGAIEEGNFTFYGNITAEQLFGLLDCSNVTNADVCGLVNYTDFQVYNSTMAEYAKQFSNSTSDFDPTFVSHSEFITYNTTLETRISEGLANQSLFQRTDNATQKTYIDAQDLSINTSATDYALTIVTENNQTIIVYFQDYISTQFTNNNTYWDLNNDTLTTYIDSQQAGISMATLIAQGYYNKTKINTTTLREEGDGNLTIVDSYWEGLYVSIVNWLANNNTLTTKIEDEVGNLSAYVVINNATMATYAQQFSNSTADFEGSFINQNTELNTTSIASQTGGIYGVPHSYVANICSAQIILDLNTTSMQTETGGTFGTSYSYLSSVVSALDTDTNANTECAGTTTYLDGEGNCDTLDEVGDFVNDQNYIGNNTDGIVRNFNVTDSLGVGGAKQYWNGTCLITETPTINQSSC